MSRDPELTFPSPRVPSQPSRLVMSRTREDYSWGCEAGRGRATLAWYHSGQLSRAGGQCVIMQVKRELSDWRLNIYICHNVCYSLSRKSIIKLMIRTGTNSKPNKRKQSLQSSRFLFFYVLCTQWSDQSIFFFWISCQLNIRSVLKKISLTSLG